MAQGGKQKKASKQSFQKRSGLNKKKQKLLLKKRSKNVKRGKKSMHKGVVHRSMTSSINSQNMDRVMSLALRDGAKFHILKSSANARNFKEQKRLQMVKKIISATNHTLSTRLQK
eukprot:78973_1